MDIVEKAVTINFVLRTSRTDVTEIPLVDEDTERELLLLLGDWYEPESTESLFSSMPSDAVFFSY